LYHLFNAHNVNFNIHKTARKPLATEKSMERAGTGGDRVESARPKV
jgi:hypothetical protein